MEKRGHFISMSTGVAITIECSTELKPTGGDRIIKIQNSILLPSVCQKSITRTTGSSGQAAVDVVLTVILCHKCEHASTHTSEQVRRCSSTSTHPWPTSVQYVVSYIHSQCYCSILLGAGHPIPLL